MYNLTVFFLQDFATRSLNMSEESPVQMIERREGEDEGEDTLGLYQLRRTWESRSVYNITLERRGGERRGGYPWAVPTQEDLGKQVSI